MASTCIVSLKFIVDLCGVPSFPDNMLSPVVTDGTCGKNHGSPVEYRCMGWYHRVPVLPVHHRIHAPVPPRSSVLELRVQKRCWFVLHISAHIVPLCRHLILFQINFIRYFLFAHLLLFSATFIVTLLL